MAINESFLKYAESYSGIDGGDINAEYWFMGMEWSDIDDIADHYTNNTWRIIEWEEIENLSEKININDTKKWALENKLNNFYKLMKKNSPRIFKSENIFDTDSNTLKLNLLPLPFRRLSLHNENWIEYEYTQKTGFEKFCEYKKAILPYRNILFKKLLQKNSKKKTILCFGRKYEDEFIYSLTADKSCKPKIEELENSKTGNGDKMKISIYNIDSDKIKKILVCPFPQYGFDEKDWPQIYKLLAE